jgi:hypothetical protein
VKAIVRSIERALGNVPALPKVELKVTVADEVKSKAPGSVHFTLTLQSLWGWFLEALPATAYRKLLTRTKVADNEYLALTNCIVGRVITSQIASGSRVAFLLFLT